jgi:hypothetical protein
LGQKDFVVVVVEITTNKHRYKDDVSCKVTRDEKLKKKGATKNQLTEVWIQVS